MKKYCYILASLLVLAGCTDRLNVAGERPVPDGEMAVNLKLEGPMTVPGTRSYVSGVNADGITGSHVIKMICFDGQGAYLTTRDGAATATDATHGTLTGTVPANTCRVHFVANFEGLNPSATFGMGSLERVMMKSPQLASGITDPVRFWGYHKEDSPEDMSAYLNGGNNLILLRDRAKVVVILGDQSNNGESKITNLEWTISNGLSKGFVAAMSSSDNNNPYDNTYATSTVLTEYRSSGTYTLSDAESIWAGPGQNDPQYIFENANSTDPVKIIVHATYADGTKRYHTFLLQDNDKKLYRVVRNQSFVLTINKLPSAAETTAIGSDTFSEAVSTTNYSNNPFAQVEREVPEINDEEYRLALEKVVYFYDENTTSTTATIPFTFTKLDGSSTGFGKTDFEASWEPKDDGDERPDVSPVTTAPVIDTYDASTGKGTITFTLNQITSDLKFNTLQLVSPTGLTRYVDVYSITHFDFKTTPELEDNGTKRPVGGIQRETYKLTFALPGVDILPKELYPLTVKMYTGTLVPFSDAPADSPHGSFNVAVGKTNSLGSTDTPSQWNYNANKWDSWYEYVINEPGDGSYTVYLNEFAAERLPQVLSTVGLYFEIEHFGTPKGLSAAAPQPQEKSAAFVPGNFNFGSGYSDDHTIEGITVDLDNFEKTGGYLKAGYRSWGTNYSGIVKVTAEGCRAISQIVVTYRSNTYGGNVSYTSGDYSRIGTTGTWTGTANDVTLTFNAGSGNSFAQISRIDVTYLSY